MKTPNNYVLTFLLLKFGVFFPKNTINFDFKNITAWSL